MPLTRPLTRALTRPLTRGLTEMVGGGFAPSDISGLAAWYDAEAEAESRSLTTAQTADLEQWDDGSGNANHLEQATEAKQPVLQWDGTRWVLRFDGSDDALGFNTAGLSLFRNVGSATVIAAVKATGTGTRRVFGLSRGTGTGTRALLDSGTTVGTWRTGGRRLDTDGAQVITGGTHATDAFTLMAVKFDWANSDVFLYQDGVLAESSTAFQTDGNTEDTASFDGAVGAEPAGSSSFLAGDLMALLFYVPAISDADREQVESYLNDRYALGVL